MMTPRNKAHWEVVSGLEFTPSDEHQSRLKWVALGFLSVSCVILLRLCYLHLIPSDQLSGEDQFHVGRMRIEIPRGEIFDRNGLVLATNIEFPSLYVDPRKVKDELQLSNYLSVNLGLPEDEVLARLAKTDANGKPRKMNPLKRWITDLPPESIAAMVERSEKALVVQGELLRYYPHGDSAAHLLGFVNRVGDASEGLELAFDKHLHARSGVLLARKDRDRRLLPSGLLSYEEPAGGEMVQLTLDINIQHSLENALDKRMEEVGAVAGMGILMDPHTGAIFALATRPAFDPNQYDAFPAELRKNRALIDVFEPGSVFKIVTACAALEHGLVTPDTMIDCEGGAFNPYGHRIKDFYKLGVIPFSRAFEKSSNIALIKLAALLGAERLEQWIRLFGFGEKTSPHFQYESRGIFKPMKEWSRLSMGSLPMGQEVAVTMPQLVRAFAVIANGGHMVQPYFVEKAVTRYGETTYQYQPPAPQRIISPATADTMRQLCHQVVLHGTGTAANIPEYRTGGKTGTAQMARKDGRGYDPDRYTTVFAGFAPVCDPRIVGVIVIQEPKIKQRYGGFVCGPVFKEVVRDALIRMGVPEDPVIELDENGVPKPMLAKKPVETPEETPKDAAETPVDLEADADTVAAPPSPDDLDADVGSLLTSLDGLGLVAHRMVEADTQRAMPDLIGKTKVEAREALQRLGMMMDAQGAGWVVSQDPPPGALLENISLCALRFSDKQTEEALEKQDEEVKQDASDHG